MVPVTGTRKNVKIYGCVAIYALRLLYQRSTVFNAETYLDFLERIARYYYPRVIYYIQDNASYHKDENVWEWFKANRSWWRVYNLPRVFARVECRRADLAPRTHEGNAQPLLCQ